MTRYFLVEASIEGFRGINNEKEPLVLKFRGDAVNSVFAPNAHGKSSVFEALCYAIKGHIPKLDALPATDVPGDYYANRFHSAKTATVDLVLKADDGSESVSVRVRRLPNGTRHVSSPSGHPSPEAVLRSLSGPMTLVDYSSFNSFIADTPLARGRTFSALLGLGKISEFRRLLETLANSKTLRGDFGIDSLSSQITTKKNQLSETVVRIKTAYRALTGAELPIPPDTAQVGVDALTALAGVPLLAAHTGGGKFEEVNFHTIRETIKAAEGSGMRDRLGEVLNELAALEREAATVDEQAEQEILRTALRKRDDAASVTSGPVYLKMYEAAEQVLTVGGWANARQCPLCDSDELDEPIGDHIENHLRRFEAVRHAQEIVRSTWSAASWVARLARLDAKPPELGGRKRSALLDERFRHNEPTHSDLDEAVGLLNELELARQGRMAALQTERTALQKKLPPSLVTLTEQVAHAEVLQKALSDLETLQRSVDDNRKKLSARQAWCAFVENASAQFAKAEVKLSTDQTLALETQYKALYRSITQNPEIVPLLTKGSGSEELFLRLERFYGLTNVSASTLLPESHRNALAIAIFLSAASNATSAARFIVLDDVTSSFDAGHQYNLMEVLRTVVALPANAGGPQIIILSHDGLLEKYFDTLSQDADWHHQRLQGLPPRGAILTQEQDADRLRALAESFLQAGQTEQASPLMRQYLEYSLLQIIRKVNVPVPIDFSIRDDRKMVENCLQAIGAAVALHKKAGTLILESSQETAFKGTHLPQLLGNWVSHYATGSTASLSPYVLLGVLNTIDSLRDCFKYSCSCNGQQRRFYKDLTRKHCQC